MESRLSWSSRSWHCSDTSRVFMNGPWEHAITPSLHTHTPIIQTFVADCKMNKMCMLPPVALCCKKNKSCLLTCKAGFLLRVNVQHVSWRVLQRVLQCCCRWLASAGVLKAAHFAYIPFVWAVYRLAGLFTVCLGCLPFVWAVYCLAGLFTVCLGCISFGWAAYCLVGLFTIWLLGWLPFGWAVYRLVGLYTVWLGCSLFGCWAVYRLAGLYTVRPSCNCIGRDSLPDRHSCLNLYPCVVKFTHPVLSVPVTTETKVPDGRRYQPDVNRHYRPLLWNAQTCPSPTKHFGQSDVGTAEGPRRQRSDSSQPSDELPLCKVVVTLHCDTASF